jgi:tetratricopeptide (TPR) repeat protein
MSLASCPDDDAVLAFLARADTAAAREALAAHFAECDSCRQLLGDLARAAPASESVVGAKHGARDAGERYMLLSTLGAGAMGVVQAAFDRQLDRKVALKFLATAPGEDAARAQARLQREAQALAKLAHPNVVTVHDVGVLEGEVYVAMELVSGGTLRDWLAARPRTTREVVAVMRQAGEGLAAAHAAGMIHRDFKPDNVLIGEDGRARVTDFGLARSSWDGDDASVEHADAHWMATLTQTGVRAGTPAYMAPEQKAGEAPSVRSDVYSYCVTVHEAVTGVRPGTPGGRRAPAWLERVVARGLSARPQDRWPTMRALLDAIDRGPPITPGRIAVAAGGVVLAAVTAILLRDRAVAARAPVCPEPVGAFAGVWDEAQRGVVERAFQGAGHEGSFPFVARALDAYADAWKHAEVDTCAETRIRGAQSERLLDLRMACLDDRRRSLGRAVSLLAKADADVATRGVEIASTIPGVEACVRARSLEEVSAPSPAQARVVADAKAALDDARALFYAGKLTEAQARLEPAIADVTRADYAPLLGQLLYWRANVERDQGRSECTTTLVAAAVKAIEGHDDAALAQIWTLYGMQIYLQSQEARGWIEQAGAAIQRLGGDDQLEGERLLALGIVTSPRSAQTATLLRARELLVKTRGPDYYLVASCDQRLGNVAFDARRFDEASEYQERAYALRLRLFGIDHAATVSSIFNRAEAAIARQHPAEARAVLRDLGGRIGSYDPGTQAWFALKMSDVDRLDGDLEGAIAEERRALALYDRGVPASDPIRAIPLFWLGHNLLDLHRPKDAIPALQAALGFLTPQGDAACADAWLALGRAEYDAGNAARGRELVARARDAYANDPDATHPEMRDEAVAWLTLHGERARAR